MSRLVPVVGSTSCEDVERCCRLCAPCLFRAINVFLFDAGNKMTEERENEEEKRCK